VKNFKFLLLLGVVLAAGLGGGCASAEKDNLSERPWNSPKGWEHGLPAGMMPRY